MIHKIWLAFLYAVDGLKAGIGERAFRQEIVVAVVAIPTAFYLAPDRVSLALMTGSILLVLIVELLNTGIEAALDRHGPEWHAQAKKAKDCGGAAVLISIINALVIWGIILLY